MTLVLSVGPAVDFAVRQFTTSLQEQSWTRVAAPDVAVTINGASRTFGSRRAGFSFVGATPVVDGHLVRLDVAFSLDEAGLMITRHYSIVSGSPTIDTWTTYAATRAGATLANLNAIQLTIPTATVHWVTGLRGDNATVERDSAFTRRSKTLAAGDRLTLGSTGRSSQQVIPWVSVVGSHETFYAALMWSGAWSLELARADDNLALAWGLGGMTTRVPRGGSLDGPHLVFGVTRGGLAQATAALGSFVIDGIRGGRAIAPQVTYNTWFSYGTDVTESALRDEMARAAAIGVELFVLDAGWYDGAGAAGAFDFDAGLGHWHVDDTKFPHGLRALTDYAHQLGMRFGVWVEPERVNLSVVGSEGLEERWLATANGQYGSDHAGQLCLANARARAWLFDRLTALLDDVQPDYLKWDNNLWINCDRDGHDHGLADGNFAHVSALYDVLAQVRARYPDLAIENVSGGGNRLDLGMLRYTDAAWMDDRTAPSVHVRHNVEGLTAIFPPAYLLSFLIDSPNEPLHGARDWPLYVRSRMQGALGVCLRVGDFTADEQTAMRREIDVYRSFRDALAASTGALLTSQTNGTNPPPWDVLQATAGGGHQIVITAFSADNTRDTLTVKPTGLAAGTTYEVRSVDVGVLGTATGAELAAHGIDIPVSAVSAAHVLILTARP